tara:strand:- start:30 stop:500 length:471 start_codon:yes stop_codon:yes gene_type:complete
MFEKFPQFLLIFFFISAISCEKEDCYQCSIYDLETFNGDFTKIKGNLNCCKNDDTWEEISWGNLVTPGEDLDQDGIPDSYVEANQLEGANLSIIDLSIYTTGLRVVESNDIDNDGILNINDDDIDNDGLLNLDDTTPYGTEDNMTIEYIVCSKLND